MALHGPKMLQSCPHLLFCIFPNGTGIDHHHIRLLQFIRNPVTQIGHDRGHYFAVREIHLAAVALHVQEFVGNW